MKIEFSNKKEKKNCQYFIRALKEVEKHTIKDPQRPLFLTLTPNDLRMTPTLSDLHLTRIDANCLTIIKNEIFVTEVQQQNKNKVYAIKSFKMLRAFKKNEARVTLIELRTTNEGLKMYLQTENKQFMCEVKVECEEVELPWPEQPQSQAEPNYELIPICRISEVQLARLSIPDERENIWLEMWQGGIYFRTVEKGKYRQESKLPLGIQSGFNFTTLKGKLKSKVFINARGQFLMDHLYETMKKKRTAQLLIKLVNDPYQENQIKFAYLLLKSSTDFGSLIKLIGCFICDQMGEAGELAIRQQLDKEREIRESSLLKREEGGVQEMRRIVMNRIADVGEEKKLAQGVYRERQPVGKMEQGEETLNRRFHNGKY